MPMTPLNSGIPPLAVGSIYTGSGTSSPTELPIGANGKFLSSNGTTPLWSDIPATSWASITGKPTFATVATSGLYSDLLSKPTTLSGYGITDAQPLDSDLTAIAALTTTTFGRSLLTQADASAARTTLGLATIASTGSASDITTGTLADARLSTNIPLLNASSQNFTGLMGFGVTPTAGDGLLQLSSGTTKANGIKFGDSKIYRYQAYGLAIDTNSAGGHQIRIYDDAAGPTLAIRAADNVYAQLLFRTYNGVTEDDRFRARADGSGLLWQTWNGSAWTDMLKVSTTGVLAFYDASGSTRQTAAAAATDAATTQTLANSLRTILINLGLAQ